MKRDTILQVIKDLARSQGFYSRLYNDLMYLSEYDFTRYDRIMHALECENFQSVIDLVLYLEG